jgi:hypothetical protein
VLYEMLAGTRAFPGDDVTDTLAAVVKLEPNWDALPDDTPARVRQAIRVCLQKDAKHRGGDIAAIRLALAGAFETMAPSNQPGTVTSTTRWVLAIMGTAIIALVLTTLVAWSVRPTADPKPVSRFELVPLNDVTLTNPGRTNVAISPDGARIAYHTSSGLYLRRLDELDARLIAGTDSPVIGPFFSPDGESIGYMQTIQGKGTLGQLKRMTIAGGASVVVADAAAFTFGASWGADGVVFFGQPQGIMRVRATGGAPELVIPAKEGETFYGPRVLPDGDSLLFSVATGQGNTRWDEGKIVVQSLSTGERTVIVEGGSDARCVPTGHVVYALGQGLFGVAFDARRRALVGGAVPLVQGVLRALSPAISTGASNYDISANGTLVYAGAGAPSTRRLVWVNRDGTNAVIDPIPARDFQGLRLSPDGQRVLVEADGDLWVYEVASGRNTRVTNDGAVRGAWDPPVSPTRLPEGVTRRHGCSRWTERQGPGN